MNKSAINKYAVWARKELIDRVTQKAEEYGISEAEIIPASADSIRGKLLTPTQKKQRTALIERIKAKGENGFKQVIDEVAYTWFNRLTAIRFMEVNGYLPSHVRVFTDEDNKFNPQILAEAIHLDLPGLDMDKVYAFKQANNTEELYKYLLIIQCNALNEILPGMFQKIEDYTELLLPDNLLREGSVIARLIADIDDDDFRVRDDGDGQIEIIGWLYQYYISEKHAEVIDPLHGGVVKKEEVPAATQLFTTDWVVRYIVDNSVGRYWIERNPNSTLKENLEYFVLPKDGKINYVNEVITPQDVTVLDPCVGSGHFLVYAFDVLMKIYTEYGYSERDAAREILRVNLFGLDIDNRATQLAYFAVMMKARQYDRGLFRQNIRPNIYSIEESNHIDIFAVDDYALGNEEAKKDITLILDTFKDAQEYGSILQMPRLNFDNLFVQLDEAKSRTSLFANSILEIEHILLVAKVMADKYAAVVTNPPYLGKYDPKLKEFVLKNYKDYSGDLFSVFIYRNLLFSKQEGYAGFMTPYVWMFIKTYEGLRKYIIKNKTLSSVIQMEYSAYEEATVPICSFVLKNGVPNEKTYGIRLSEFRGGMAVQNEKVLEALASDKCDYLYEAEQQDFLKIPGSPIAYWVGENLLKTFDNKKIGDFGDANNGFTTGDNNLFLRLWHEVLINNINFSALTHEDAEASRKKWFPYNKGGAFRKWYGNNDYVLNWGNNGAEIKAYGHLVPRSMKYQFWRSISWSKISSSVSSFKIKNQGTMFDVAGLSLFPFSNDNFNYLLGLCNSCYAQSCLDFLSPTLNYETGHIASIPVATSEQHKDTIDQIVEENISISKADWDSVETSWDFATHPFIKYANTLWDATAIGATMNKFYGRDIPKHNSPLELCYLLWQGDCAERFATLKANEEELNRLFIDIYGLNDELSPEVADKDVTVRKADLGRDIRSFISYAVGCMFGRYSLNMDGIAYAGGEWDESKYIAFKADRDNVLPICDDEYFEDDIVGKFVKFVEVVFGKDTLEENLKFIADALGGSGSPRDVIRSYFLNDFYADHLKVYQKRPIYWQFDSGKKNGFKCLIYMHRYQPDTIARIRTDYVHEQQARYRTAIADLEQRIQVASTSERVKLTKLLQKLKDQEIEIRLFEEKVHHLADQMIRIDLDNGVKHNYEIFKDVLTKIK